VQRVERTILRDEIADAIRAYQAEVNRQRQDQGFSAVSFWDHRRQTKAVLEVLATLKQMAGAHQKCMYCVNSEAGDIEHFRPKTPYPEHMFRWENLLLCCGICGRKKGNQFPMADGQPLLIDPTSENPWEFLDLDRNTGNIVPRIEPISGEEKPKGRETVRVLELDRRQSLANGYKRSASRIIQVIEDILEEGLNAAHLSQLCEADDHGLLGWFLHGSGQNEPAFSSFRGRFPEAWSTCKELFH
jgi:uncharacterized protein (TIGR02646 family)